ncbi:MAG: LysM peptidoglycan-binding domain-containing protein [Desulfobulbaceae bacterium]|nr:LysM peptidoglycan-binding domain-containing protein [Desulfobulbaceae bacterium]
MKISRPLLLLGLNSALFAAFLSGCASLSENAFIPTETDHYASTDSDLTITPVIQYAENEPEQVLEEELTALDKIGKWEETPGIKIIQTPEPEIVPYDFPVVINKQVEFYLDLFQTKQRGYFERWLARSSKYIPYIQEHLKEAGLPLDLAYLAMIESGFNPSAYSKSHAAGMWQFIRTTGQNYGLQIDSWVDERRDPEKSTRAAINYLSFLYHEFDSWYLAVAAYNAGEGKIGRGIKKYDTDDFWKLAGKDYLTLETKRYVPKLIASIIIAKNPEKYGFTNIEYQEPLRYDVIEVPPRTDLNAVAMASNFDIKDIRSLNNELLKNYTPPGRDTYELKIPGGTYDLVAKNLSRLHPVVTMDFKTHVVKSGDTLTAICRLYDLNKTTLLKANNLHSAKLLVGQRLRIPYQATKYVLLKDGETPEKHFASSGEDGQLFLHEIKRGETLSRISKLYDVPVEVIMQWNNLTSKHKITAGQHIALYLAQPSQNDILVATTDYDSLTPDEAGRKSKVTYYQVKSGDSLWGIARKFKVSANQIMRWNNLKSNLIHPGIRLVVKKA